MVLQNSGRYVPQKANPFSAGTSGGVGGAGHAKPWGDKEGSEQDREALKRIIVAKLQTAGTAGDFCSKMK